MHRGFAPSMYRSYCDTARWYSLCAKAPSTFHWPWLVRGPLPLRSTITAPHLTVAACALFGLYLRITAHSLILVGRQHCATADALLALALLPARYDVPTTHEQQEILCKNSYTAQHPTHASTRTTRARTHTNTGTSCPPAKRQAASSSGPSARSIGTTRARRGARTRTSHTSRSARPISKAATVGRRTCRLELSHTPCQHAAYTCHTPCSVHLSHTMQRTPVAQHAPP